MSYDASAQAAQMITQLALVQGSITTVGTLENAPPAVLNTVYVPMVNALAPYDTAIAGYEADIDTTTFAGVPDSGVSPVTMAADLLEQMQDVTQESVLKYARAYLARATFNVLNSPG